MAVHIRLLRMGKKKQPFYRIVAADSRRARDGRFLEIVGTYNTIIRPAEVKLAEDKVTKWFNEGAEPTDTVRSLLTQVGFIEKYNQAKSGKDVSEIVLKTTINERKKKTRKVKKAALKAAEEAEKAAEEAKKAAEEAAKAKEEAKAKAAEEAAAAAEAKKAEAEAPAEEKTDEAPDKGDA